MYADYVDILKRITDAPVWWDEHGVPRFDPFRPEDSPSLYTEECALVEVVCRVCNKHFHGEVNSGVWRGTRLLETLVREGAVSYGNPPRHTCIGDGMEGRTARVVEFWRRAAAVMLWERVPGLEVEVLGALVGGSESGFLSPETPPDEFADS